MDSKRDIVKEKVVEKLHLPLDVIVGVPKVTITGNKEIIIENHKGVESFESNCLKLNSKIGKIVVNGQDLEILFIGGDTITLGGRFKSLEYEELTIDDFK